MSSRSSSHIVNKTDDDDEWLFDSILGFLSSPIWSIPIQHFLEVNCSSIFLKYFLKQISKILKVFSPNDSWSGGSFKDEDDDENLESVPTEYIDVHVKYKDLVDALIGTFLQDLGVSYNQFLKACRRTSSLNENSAYLVQSFGPNLLFLFNCLGNFCNFFLKEFFEQIWSAENFRMFKSLMVRKNIELELQALILLQYQLGIIKSGNDSINSDDDKIMQLVIKKSADEYQSIVKSRNASQNSRCEMESKDYETAKKLVKSNELVEALNDELDQQEYLNRKILKENLKKPASDRPASARKSKVEDHFKNMKIQDNSKNEEDKAKIVSDFAQTVLEVDYKISLKI